MSPSLPPSGRDQTAPQRRSPLDSPSHTREAIRYEEGPGVGKTRFPHWKNKFVFSNAAQGKHNETQPTDTQFSTSVYTCSVFTCVS